MTDAYQKSRTVWEGRICTYQQPGSFPIDAMARIIEIGHMVHMPATFTAEVAGNDALGQIGWRGTIDPEQVLVAFSAYVRQLRSDAK